MLGKKKLCKGKQLAGKNTRNNKVFLMQLPFHIVLHLMLIIEMELCQRLNFISVISLRFTKLVSSILILTTRQFKYYLEKSKTANHRLTEASVFAIHFSKFYDHRFEWIMKKNKNGDAPRSISNLVIDILVPVIRLVWYDWIKK